MGVLFGIIFITIGLLSFSSSFVKSNIRFGNTMQGTKTHITKGTLIWAKTGGFIAILIGLFLIMSGSWIGPKTTGSSDYFKLINSQPK